MIRRKLKCSKPIARPPAFNGTKYERAKPNEIRFWILPNFHLLSRYGNGAFFF